jgi:hypothetical protein
VSILVVSFVTLCPPQGRLDVVAVVLALAVDGLGRTSLTFQLDEPGLARVVERGIRTRVAAAGDLG